MASVPAGLDRVASVDVRVDVRCRAAREGDRPRPSPSACDVRCPAWCWWLRSGTGAADLGRRRDFAMDNRPDQTQSPARADAAGRDAALVAACLRLALVDVSVAMTLQLAQRRRKAFPAPWTTALWLSVEHRARLLRPCRPLCGGTRWQRRSARSSENPQTLHRPPSISMALAFVRLR